MCASVWETKNKGEPSGYLMSLGCWMQLLFRVGETAQNGRQGRWTCTQKMVLNKEAWSCKVLLGKLLTFLQVKCLKELQSQAPRKWGYTPKNQHLGTQTGENTSSREESQCNAFYPNLPAPNEGCRDCIEKSRYCCTYRAMPIWASLLSPMYWVAVCMSLGLQTFRNLP